ncbi:hypothetical protein OH492_25380 [Vibrio chagasii]|nr:hypothetical protein [Vibrio chagasii]
MCRSSNGDGGWAKDRRHQLEHGRHTDDRDACRPFTAQTDTVRQAHTASLNIGTDGVWTYF